MQKVISIQTNNCIVNSEKMLLTWLNAYEYHRERDKQKLFESNQGLSKKQINEASLLVQGHYEEIIHAWRSYF